MSEANELIPQLPKKEYSWYGVLQDVLLDWDIRALRDLFDLYSLDQSDLVELILDSSMLSSEDEERILREAGRLDEDGKPTPPPRLCGGASTPAEEYQKYREFLQENT